MSDNWFLSGNGQIHHLLATVCVGLFLPYLDEDGSVGFDRLEATLPEVYAFALRMRKRILKEIVVAVASGTYRIDGYDLDFSEVTDIMLEMYQTIDGKFDEKMEMFKDSDFWMNILHYAEMYSPETDRRIRSIKEEETAAVERWVVSRLTDGRERAAPKCEDITLKDAVIDVLSRLGAVPYGLFSSLRYLGGEFEHGN